MARLNAILSGQTGVGKTELLRMYSYIINAGTEAEPTFSTFFFEAVKYPLTCRSHI
jgi:DNA replication protein DnaC